MLQSPRLTLAIDALLRVYDHVLLDAGTASDLPAELLTTQARAVVVPDASMPDDARIVMSDELKAVGFSDVAMLSGPSLPSRAIDPGPRVVAAELERSTGQKRALAKRAAQLLRDLEQRRVVLDQVLGAVEAGERGRGRLAAQAERQKLSKISSSSLQNSRL